MDATLGAMAGRDAGSEAPGGNAALAAIVALARTGDRVAFEQLLAIHERRVLRTALGLLGNHEDARDAAQEAFLRIHRFLDRFDQRRDFAAWLYRIVVNACRDVYRRQKRVAAVPLDEIDPTLLAADGEQEMRADAADRERLLRQALGALAGKEREAIVLRDIEGLSTAEVALAMGCLEVTVRSHVSRARLKLAAALRGLEGGRA